MERLREEGTALLTQWLMQLDPEHRAALASAIPALEALAGQETPVRRPAKEH
jgi:hypothetical protein